MAKEKNQELTLEEAQAIIAQQDSVIADLTAENEKLAGLKTIKLPTVTFQKKKYNVTIPKFNFAGEIILAEELESKPEVIKALVEMESAILDPIN